MGQKINPKGFRIGVIRSWDSNWFANKQQYKKLLHEDIRIREMIHDYFKEGFISKVEILRNANVVNLTIHTSRPGSIIGRQGEGIEKFQEALGKKFHPQKFSVSVKEIKNPDIDSTIVAENIAKQISRRVPHRRAIKTAIQRAMESGAKGIKVIVKGRLNGVEIARSETYTEGKIPLHTLRANIDYVYMPSQTTFGVIGVKVWIYKGDVFMKVSEMMAEEKANQLSQPNS